MNFNQPSAKTIKNILDKWSRSTNEQIYRIDLPTELQFTDLMEYASLFRGMIRCMLAVDWSKMPDNITDGIINDFNSLDNHFNLIMDFSIQGSYGHGNLKAARDNFSAGFKSTLCVLIAKISQFIGLSNVFAEENLTKIEDLRYLSSEIEKLKASARGLSDDYSQKITELKEELIAEKVRITQVIFEKIANADAIKHFEDNHRKSSLFFLLCLLFTSLYLAFFVYLILPCLAVEWPKKLSEVGPELVFKLTLSILLIIWPIRILIKTAMTFLHLKIDSSEKIMFMKSYLALSANPDVAFGEEEKKIIFSSIF